MYVQVLKLRSQLQLNNHFQFYKDWPCGCLYAPNHTTVADYVTLTDHMPITDEISVTEHTPVTDHMLVKDYTSVHTKIQRRVKYVIVKDSVQYSN